MISFGTKYWLILLLAIIAATFGIVILLYFRNKENNELSKIQVRILMVLRFFSFFLIALLLLSPFIKNLKKIIHKPLVIIALDNSSSMLSTNDSVSVKTQINNLKNNFNSKLGSQYTVLNYLFGEETVQDNNPDFKDKESDYSRLITKINEDHFNENIGALILVGDGIYNQGKNPINLSGDINFPLFSVAFGDTSEVLDARIENVLVNRTAFSGNRFPVEIESHFTKMQGRVLKLAIYENEKEIESVAITPLNNDFFISHEFILEAKNAGLKHYTASIQTLENERNTINNSTRFVLNILENKQKVLILSDGNHPDIGAIKNTLDLQKTYDVAVFTAEPYPSNLSDFNLIILNQLPTSRKSMAEIIEKSKSARIPVLYLIGNKTFIPQFNTINQNVTIEPLAGATQEEVQAVFNSSYATFILSEEFQENLKKFPPLQVPFADFKIPPELNTLFYQKIKNIETSKPLFLTGNINGIKTAYIFGEGLWKWRLADYHINQNQKSFNEIVNHLVQYLALRENEDNFMISFSAIYHEIEDVILHAEVYNDSYEPINSEEISIKMENEDGEEYSFIFDSTGKEYTLNAGKLPTGDYRFNAEVTIGKETFKENGQFTVIPVNIESTITKANHQVLFQLSDLTGGKFYLPNETNKLIQNLSENKLKTTSYFQEMINELLNLRWLFFVVLLLLSVEWFLRKYWGIY